MINVYPPATQTVIDSVHKHTHEGRYFSGGYYNAAVANGDTVDILIQAGTESTHAKFKAVCGGDSTLQVYEGATFSAAGTAVTMSNHNRGSAKAFDGTVTHTPTITGTGTQINGTALIAAGVSGGGGGGGGSSGGRGSDSNSFASEFILAASTDYLVRITNNSGAATKIESHVEAYQPNL